MPTRLLLVFLIAATLFACGEKPQTLSMSSERAAERDQLRRADGQRQRTLDEGGGNRVYNEGILR